ncbi:MAG: hypothetical protein R2828_32515 [Saprospiraceae bacterium]
MQLNLVLLFLSISHMFQCYNAPKAVNLERKNDQQEIITCVNDYNRAIHNQDFDLLLKCTDSLFISELRELYAVFQSHDEVPDINTNYPYCLRLKRGYVQLNSEERQDLTFESFVAYCLTDFADESPWDGRVSLLELEFLNDTVAVGKARTLLYGGVFRLSFMRENEQWKIKTSLEDLKITNCRSIFEKDPLKHLMGFKSRRSERILLDQELRRYIKGNYRSLGINEIDNEVIPISNAEKMYKSDFLLPMDSIKALRLDIRNLDKGDIELMKKLKDFQNLEYLHLISIIPDDLFDYLLSDNTGKLEYLKTLILYQRIKYLPEGIKDLKNLEILQISLGDSVRIPENVFKLKNLKSLIIEGYSYESLPTEIGQLENLQELKIESLKGQKLDLPEEIRKLDKLKHLTIRTKVDSIHRFLDAFPFLESLALEGADLTKVPKLKHLKCLRMFNPKSLQGIENLESLIYLQISANETLEYSTRLGALSSLKGIEIYDKTLSKIPQFIQELSNLEYLNLLCPEISDINLNCRKIRNLKMIAIQGNDYSEYPIRLCGKRIIIKDAVFGPQNYISVQAKGNYMFKSLKAKHEDKMKEILLNNENISDSGQRWKIVENILYLFSFFDSIPDLTEVVNLIENDLAIKKMSDSTKESIESTAKELLKEQNSYRKSAQDLAREYELAWMHI